MQATFVIVGLIFVMMGMALGDHFSCSEDDGKKTIVCGGHGQCVRSFKLRGGYHDVSCNCEQLYHGKRCENTECFSVSSTDETVCSGHGVCKEPNRCKCDYGFTGQDCNKPESALFFDRRIYTPLVIVIVILLVVAFLALCAVDVVIMVNNQKKNDLEKSELDTESESESEYSHRSKSEESEPSDFMNPIQSKDEREKPDDMYPRVDDISPDSRLLLSDQGKERSATAPEKTKQNVKSTRNVLEDSDDIMEELEKEEEEDLDLPRGNFSESEFVKFDELMETMKTDLPNDSLDGADGAEESVDFDPDTIERLIKDEGLDDLLKNEGIDSDLDDEDIVKGDHNKSDVEITMGKIMEEAGLVHEEDISDGSSGTY